MGWRRYYWLDLYAMCDALKPRGSTLAFVNYYTSRSKETTRSREISTRQEAYWRALSSTPVNLIQGKIAERDCLCESQCRNLFTRFQEKETDVKIGIDIISDALLGKLEGVLLVTGDTDQRPTLQLLSTLKPGISRKLVFPPSARKFPKELTELAHRPFTALDATILAKFQFQDIVQDRKGIEVRRPDKWR